MTISSTEKTARALAIRPGDVILWSAVLKLVYVNIDSFEPRRVWVVLAHSVMMLPGTAMDTVYSRPPVG